MKSGILPLVLLGAGAWFLAKPKKEPTSNGKGVITGSKDRGYIITNCNLVIIDKQKALDYAFALGVSVDTSKDWNTKVLKFNLFGDCLSSEEKGKKLMNSKEKALFVFDLLKFLDSGISSNDQSFDQDALLQLDQLKSNIAKITGIDTSDFKVELVKKE